MKKYLIIGASALVLFFGITSLNLNTETAEALQNQEAYASQDAIFAADAATPEAQSPTPSATAEPTVSPTPTATPKATPKPAPKAAPKATPKPTAKAAPKPAPKATPAPKPTTAAPAGKASAIISTAKSYMGVPYVWGGTSPSGFDCSGFINYVYSKHGVSLPRVTADQYNAGSAVSKSSLKSGDLVFFETYKPGPSHVGIYLGSNQFIHASSGAGKVIISSLTSDYYTSHYIGARRVL